MENSSKIIQIDLLDYKKEDINTVLSLLNKLPITWKQGVDDLLWEIRNSLNAAVQKK